MPLFYKVFHGLGFSLSASWQGAMFVPAAKYLVLALWIYFCTQDTTTGKFKVAVLGKTTKTGFGTYGECLKDYRVILMTFQYNAGFGSELVRNNLLASHFHDYFGVALSGTAGAVIATWGSTSTLRMTWCPSSCTPPTCCSVPSASSSRAGTTWAPCRP
jgi:nitrate/nitrite transporter NarK